MNTSGRRCLVLVEISNGYRMECHIAEMEIDLNYKNVIDWVQSRDNHLGDDMRGTWTYADVYIIPAGESIDRKRYALTIRNRHSKPSR